jgi:hypothetical protein
MATKQNSDDGTDRDQGAVERQDDFYAERVELEDLRERLGRARDAILSDAERKQFDDAHAAETARDNAFEGQPPRETSDPDLPQERQPEKDCD